jgi:hypothetical protein
MAYGWALLHHGAEVNPMSINKLSVPPPEPRLISVTACAAMLDVSETTVRKLIRIGSLQAVHIVGCQRIKVASVETILNSGVSPAAMGRAEPDDFDASWQTQVPAIISLIRRHPRLMQEQLPNGGTPGDPYDPVTYDPAITEEHILMGCREFMLRPASDRELLPLWRTYHERARARQTYVGWLLQTISGYLDHLERGPANPFWPLTEITLDD